MMEMIRKQLMVWFQKKKEVIAKWTTKLCPKIIQLIEATKLDAKDCEVTYVGNDVFKVVTGVKIRICDIGQRVCRCRRWDITGIPCVHGVAAILACKKELENFVSEYYLSLTWNKVYSPMIMPIPDQSMWERTPFDPILPPPLRRPPGRPKKARKKSVDEPQNSSQVSRRHNSLKCGNCGNIGHNIRTCKGPMRQAPRRNRGGISVGGKGSKRKCRGGISNSGRGAYGGG